MNKPNRLSATIFIVSDSMAAAALVQQLLKAEFENALTSTNQDEAGVDFDRHRPDVLVLAFDSIEKSERHNLGLYRQSKEIRRHTHRTIILCNKDEVQRAYQLCRDEIFDDYVLFWPLAQDASRLPMAVHHALRELVASKEDLPRPTEFASQLRNLEELETLLKQQMAKGDKYIESTGRTIAQAEMDIAKAVAGFSRSLAQGDLSRLVEARNAKALQQAFDRLTQESIEAPLHTVADIVQPLREWSDELKQASAPHLESMRSLCTQAEHAKPTVMVVDDDEFQHKIVSRLVKGEGYHLVFASSGIEALNMLHKIQADLILMDLSMPDMDGLEVTRRVKGVVRFARIPIIMITGNSEENIVTDCLNAGAVDFMVKPFFRETLIAKIAKVLGPEMTKSQSVVPMSDLNQSDF